MTRYLCWSLLVGILLCGSAVHGAPFDERLWEKYAEVEPSPMSSQDGLAGIYLEPQELGDVTARTSFSDLRLITGRKEEVTYQVVARRPERRVCCSMVFSGGCGNDLTALTHGALALELSP